MPALNPPRIWVSIEPSTQEPAVSSDDAEQFRKAMTGVRRLEADDRAWLRPPPPSPRAHQTEAEERRVLQDLLSDAVDPADFEIGDELLFHRAGLQQPVLRKLRRGHYAVEGELDLHGHTVPDARHALTDFLAECGRRGRRCVRIIHGKGKRSPDKQPVLKVQVNHWLRQRNEVLAFCSARPVDGGTGAVYVLLRRSR